jgi:hypothetical protein
MMAGGFPEWRYDARNYQQDAGSISELTNRRGRILFKMTPGTDEAAADGMYVGAWHNLSANYIKLYFSGHNTLKLEYYDLSASARSDTWDCSGALDHTGTAYDVKIEYNRTFMKLYVDNTLRITLSYDVDFGTAVPDYFTLGTDIDAGNAYTSTTYTYPTMNIYDYQETREAG